MPITKQGESTQMEFGYGDIEVAPALLQHEEVTGAVCFFRRETPNPIGARGDYEKGMVVEAEHTPVRMIFNKIESIDVVIRALEEAKSLMLNRSA